ncbi:unnamed protein product [Caenorhabditis bovis]|uniref:Thyroglobulin type-1 domain-containing protein n=1 Tax=Caenorhabditis bovis TaxID=2654633 RepID=A0A8S1F520_9PELO|nr:unnamed protein product [Caenorhabditis bovis]
MLNRALLIGLLAISATAKLQIFPNDAEEKLCIIAGCADDEMCVVDTTKNSAKCVDQAQLQQFVKAHQLEHSPIARHQQHHTAAEHAEHDFNSKHQCSRLELLQMGGRLLKWFKDVHTTEAGNDRTLRMHSMVCRPEVAWMFVQWDGNNDGQLTKSELRSLERGGNERCIEQFIDMCDDIDVDGTISVDEWCDCFTFSDDVRHEPPCHKAKHGADPHLLGVFIPRCDLEGYYKPEQCHDGHCWCVDRYGREFDKSRVQNQLPDCGQYASDLTEEDVAFLKARF